MEYHMLYVKCRKSFEVRRQIFFITLPCVTKKLCQKKTHHSSHTRQNLCLSCDHHSSHRTLPCDLILSCVFLSTLGKIYVCRVPVNLHSANLGAHGKNEVSGSVFSLKLNGQHIIVVINDFNH